MSPSMNRRDFLKLGALLAASMGLGATAVPTLADGLEKLSLGETPVLWLQGLACSGCSVSFLNSDEPGPAELLTQYINLLFHCTLSTATGEVAMGVVNNVIARGDFFLVAEGALPATMPEACIMGEKPMNDWMVAAAKQARAILTVGTCASFGGIPAAENNPTGAVSVPEYLGSKGVAKPTIRLPGCPVHPDWVVGTLAHLLSFGMPELDTKGRPLMFFERTLHEQCPRFADYERERFAHTFGDPGCLFELGCVGPRTHSDCPSRLWNNRTNFCIQAGAPCVGCAAPEFAREARFPMYTKGVDLRRKEDMA